MNALPIMTEQEESTLWDAWQSGRTPALRQTLAERYLWLAKAVAFQVMRSRSTRDGVEYRELVQLASLGLLEAIDRFDPARGVKFSHFASKRVRGAVLDGIANLSEYHAQAALRRRIELERTESLASNRQQKLFEEMADIAVGLAIGFMLEDTQMFVDQERDAGGSYNAGEVLVLREQLLYLVNGLAEQERLVIRYHYYHGLPFKEIGDLLDLSKGRISQVHSKAIADVRKRYAELGVLDLRF